VSPRLSLDYFDGRSARAQPAEIWLQDGQLHIAAGGQVLRHARRQVLWPERQRHGQRQAQLPGGGLLSAPDAGAWDDWACASGLHDSLTVRWMQSWRRVLAAVVLLLALLLALWRWGIPLAAEGVLALLPATAEQQIGDQALTGIERLLLQPSRLAPARQAQIAADFRRLVAAGYAPGQAPDYRLHFRAADTRLGPNALALPGGHIVLTDALAELLADAPDALMGVLAHELGHVEERHGLRLVLQAGLVGALAGLVVGDFSTVLAGMPTVLGESAYSRDFERAADAAARRLLLADGRAPRAMLIFFERIAAQREQRGSTPLPIAIASHPADSERIAFFSRP
jgi:Zn-dependent protease with chaperone function